MSDRLPATFCDGILEANVMHGVVRITLGQAGADGKPLPCGQLILPLTQLPAVANAFVQLVKQVQEKLKEAQPKPAERQPGQGETPPAFRFS